MIGEGAVAVEGYTRETYPVGGVLHDLTDTISRQGYDAFDGFFAFHQELARRKTVPWVYDYATISLTTGGHYYVKTKKIIDGIETEVPLDPKQVVQANTRTNRRVAVHLAAKGDIEPGELILPADLGYISHYSQLDYMLFWGCTIAVTNPQDMLHGPKPADAFRQTVRAGLRKYGVDESAIRNTSLPRQERAVQFMRFGRAMARTALQGFEQNPRPVRRLLSFTRQGVSLGSDAERTEARVLGIPEFGLTAMQPVDPVTATAGSPALQEDVRILRQYGEDICLAPKGASLTLQRVSA